MKKFLNLMMLTVLFVALSASFASCCNDDDDEPSANDETSDNVETSTNNLKGDWVCIQGDDEIGAIYHIEKSSGYYLHNHDGRKDVFTDYKVENNVLYIMWEDDKDWDQEGLIKIENKLLYIKSSYSIGDKYSWNDGEFAVYQKQ